MTPGGCVQATINLLATIEQITYQPANSVIHEFLRKSRYMGVEDRRVVVNRVWAILRCLARLKWWVGYAVTRCRRRRCRRHSAALLYCHANADSSAHVAYEQRVCVFAYLILVEGYSIDRLAKLASDNYGPAGFTQRERDLLTEIVGQPLEHPAMPSWVYNEVPPWLEELLTARFGEALQDEITILNREASVDLRVNTLKTTRDKVRALLTADGIESVPTPFSPVGLRVAVRGNMAKSQFFRNGLVEIQDEGSQIVSILVSAKPDQAVIDYCAGAGGKTLALAANMLNRGRLVACDISAGRMGRSAARLRRAGVYNVTYHLMDDDPGSWLRHVHGQFDRVLVDVPCTATGTWRRSPDARWRLQPEEIRKLTICQSGLLAKTSQLVRPSGRLVYATCSLLTVENEVQVEQFLTNFPEFHLLSAARVWSESAGVIWPFNSSSLTLQLTPAQHGTDGYFIAVLERHEL